MSSGGLCTVKANGLVLPLLWGAVALCLLSAGLSQATAREMMLADCVSAALGANRDLADARESLVQAHTGIAEARSGFMPSLSLSGSYNFLEKTQKVEFPTPTGGTEQMELDFTRDYGLEVTLSQPLYAGGRLSSSYRMSKLLLDIAEADIQRREADVALSVIEGFYSHLLAKESVGVAGEAIKTAEEFLRVVRARYDAGEASSFEVMRAEVELGNLRPALISAENGVALAELALKNLMGMGLGELVTFTGSFDTTGIGPAGGEALGLKPDQAVAEGIDNRPEIKILKRRGEIAGQGLRLAKAGRLPSLGISANYDLRSDDVSLESDKWEKTYNGYLVLSVPIFDGLKTKSQIAKSRSGMRQADISLAAMREAVELEIRSSMLEVEASRERLASQEKNVEMAQEGLKIANDRYVQGVATNLEVMDAQLALTQAKNYRLQALHDLSLAKAKMERAIGVLLTDAKTGAR